MLGEALHRESLQFKPRTYKFIVNKNKEVVPDQRNTTVQWLYKLNRQMRFNPETFFLTTAILDKFLHSVKAHPKYLKCIGVACFYLAAKTLEEDDVIPGTLELVRTSQCGCSVAEVIRMERLVLDKLNWDIKLTTPLDFLHIFHSLLLSNIPHLLDRFAHVTPARQMALLTRKLDVCVQRHESLDFRPSTLALSLLSLELEQFAGDWFTITHMVQRLVQVPDENLIRCREMANHYLNQSLGNIYSGDGGGGGGGLYTVGAPAAPGATRAGKRKVPDAEDDDDIYEGIKRLYSDDPVEVSASASAVPSVTVTMTTSCGGEARQDDSTALTALQAVANY